MKKTILLLTATTFSLFSCDQPNTSSTQTKAQEQPKPKTLALEEAEAEQLNSGIRKDTIIDGLVFGMNQKQASKVLSQLKKEKKVKTFAPNPEGDQLLADYNIGVKDYIANGLMTLRFHNNELFLCQINFPERMNKPLYVLSDDFLKLFEENLGTHQFSSGGAAGTLYIWVAGNKSISIGDMQVPGAPYYVIEYKDNGRFASAMNDQQEDINKKKPKI